MFVSRLFPQYLRYCNKSNIVAKQYVSTLQKTPVCKPAYDVIENASQTTPGCRVPAEIPRPPYIVNDRNDGTLGHRLIRSFFSGEAKSLVKNAEMIDRIHQACRVGRRVLNHVGLAVQPGVTTEELDFIVHQLICEQQAYPSPLGYKSFPKSVCTSVNNIVVHGIPDSRSLIDGDIINVDISVYLNGVHGDLSEMFLVGDVDDAGIRLVEVTKNCLDRAIQICGPGEKLSTIGRTVSSLAEEHGFSVCPHFVGHGIGEDFHEAPQILHQYNDFPGTMVPGMVFTIEPVLCEGTSDVLYWDDGWTVVTADKKRAAQYEHTICITDDGVKVLTRNDENDEYLKPSQEKIDELKEMIMKSKHMKKQTLIPN